MNLKILATGSSGNCYILSAPESTIMLDCGISIDRINKGGDYKIHEIDACVLSHEH
jgi:phosphoribosyl 1,2-cyclic phosphodiesterase